MNYVQKIARIRSRGQLTVPNEIRQALSWPQDEELVVKIESAADGFKVERLPLSHPQHPKKQLTKEQADKIWEDMKRISKLGKKGVNLTAAIRQDRDTHF